MYKTILLAATFLLLATTSFLTSDARIALAQDAVGDGTDSAINGDELAQEEPVIEDKPASGIEPKVREVIGEANKRVSDLANEVDANERAKEAKASVLKPIYALAEQLSFPAFHWLAFMFMVTGCVSFALQLVLGKLVALTKLGFSISEILSDALGLVISLVGLVLTTQAATENSTFTESAFSVLSAAILGLILGCVFYIWGQRQELQAIDARRAQTAASKD